MTWRYRCYRFPSEGEFTAPRARLDAGGAAFAITGRLPVEQGAEPVEGFFVQVAWPGEPAASWEAYLIPEPLPGMTVFAGWDQPEAIGPIVSKPELLGLLTLEEQLAYVTSPDPVVALWRYKAALEDSIDLRSPRVAEALDAFVAAEVIAPERKPRILAGLPPV